MKMVKRLFTVLMSFLMVLVLAMPALAEGDTLTGTGEGSITINNASKDETYRAFKIFDATYNSTTKTSAYYIAPNDTTGVLTAAQKDDSPFDVAKVADSNGRYAVTLKSGKQVNDVKTWLEKYSNSEDETNYIIKNLVAIEPTTQWTNDKKVVFDNLAYGYYYITSSLGAVITIDSATPDATVIDKNDNGPTIDPDKSKTITYVNNIAAATDTTYTTAQVGDTVSFQIQFTATNYWTKDGVAEQITSYKVSDTPTALSIKTDTLVVKVGNTDVTAAVKAATNTSITAAGFTLNIPWAEITYKDQGEGPQVVDTITNLYDSPVTVTITYDAVVTNAADAATNKATIQYYHLDTQVDTDKDTNEDTVDPVAFGLVKTDDDKMILQGAQFSLWDAAEGGHQIFVCKNADGTYSVANKNADGTGYVNASNEAMSKSDAIEAGNVTIKGLDGSKDYYLQEDVAPAGYNKLTERQKVSFTANVETKKYADNVATVSDGKYVSGGIQVINEAGAQLPSTGGMGTMLFYVIGAILVVAAGVLLVTKRRMKDDK